MSYRFIGGGGAPYAIQNVLPILFNMSVKNYVIATFVGSMPSMFVTVSLGSGIENVIDQNATLSIVTVLYFTRNLHSNNCFFYYFNCRFL